MKIFRRISAFILSAAIVISMGMTVSAKELVTIDGYKYVSEGGEKTLYTGWATVNGLHRYYKEGKRCIGWHKINGSYYYLTKNGGRARGLYQIGDTVYEFDDNGKYTGKKYSPSKYEEENSYALQNAAEMRIRKYVEREASPEGDITYSDDFGGFGYSINLYGSGRETILYLTEKADKKIYDNLRGDCINFSYAEAKIPYNDIYKLYKYVSQGSIREEFNIFELNLSGNELHITINDIDETAIYEHLIENGFSEKIINIYIIECIEADDDWDDDDYE